MPAADRREVLFWAAVAVLVGARLVLSSDLSVWISYGPHDDSLYVERAYYLLRGEGFGPYDSRILVKYPGLSFWLAGMAAIGVPYLWSVNALYVLAGVYMASAALRSHAKPWAVLAGMTLYLLNPVSYGTEWLRVLREPLGTALFVVILAAMTHVLIALEERRAAWIHAGGLAAAFAFAVFLREDDRLLWGLLLIFAAALAWRAWSKRPIGARALVPLLAVVILPAVLAKAYEYSLRSFVERHYGLPIIHELGEGEYPRFLAAVRSIDSAKDNRMVMVTQEALAKLRVEVPALRPVIDRLPPPGPGTLSCRIHGVCTEWSNGWMPFWIRDEAYRAGLTPSLPAAQQYFRAQREAIERACQAGRLQCTPKGQGLVPPIELRWLRAYVGEGLRLVRTALAPEPHIVVAMPVLFSVSPELARVFQAVTRTSHANTEWRSPGEVPSLRGEGLGTARLAIAAGIEWLGAAILLLAAVVLALRVRAAAPLSPFALICVVFGLYSLLRLAALSYVAVYMGGFDPRMMFSLYTAGLLLAVPFIAGTYAAPGRAQR